MMFVKSSPEVIIEDGAVGWSVWVEVDEDTVMHEMHFDVRAFAQAYARGLSASSDYPISDRSTDLPGWQSETPVRRTGLNIMVVDL